MCECKVCSCLCFLCLYYLSLCVFIFCLINCCKKKTKKKKNIKIAENYVMHIFMRSNICHVRLYQIFPDITLILVSYFYLLINHIPFSPKILTNNTSTWVFILQKKRCSSHHHIKQDLAVSDYTRYFQISRLISSATCICSLLHVSIYQVFFFKSMAY